ncbi:hypothetical protein EUTSA_v10029509mg [Eutrema salsugineum]|uniref:F-box associated beta-propeller type 1 domain-containing protein n=1 Tax=Eutrema salsugineum TaxID=72664 RepID=V4KK85_EUTSA|nr:hypothetical protein EUTSA_v10029509mg [Eutrema salsugineum]
MREVRSTCRTWDSLSKSRSFAKMQIEKTAFATKEGESRMIMLMDDNLYLKSVVFDNDPSIEPKGKLTCLDKQVKISQVFYCEGLLWIKTRYLHKSRYEQSMDLYVYALGYVNKKNRSCRSHKILRFTDDDLCLLQAPGSNFLWYEIYDFDTGLWTTLNVFTPHWRIWFFKLGMTLKGNTYWLASERKPKEEDFEHHIICFDFTRERFGPLLHLPFSAGGNDLVSISCVRKENLAVSLKHMEAWIFEIWITFKS